LPTLNMITPVGVQAPRGKKKGKTFVDDQVCFFLSCLLLHLVDCIVGEHDDDSCHC
jgi:hypothetical protein